MATLSEQELLDHFTALVHRDRRTTAELLVAIAEIDERKIWAKHACSSMFTFCMERFHMSEQVTAKRLWAARTARRFPVILGMVERGDLNLTVVHLLAKHLTEENHIEVLERAKHKSSREVEVLVAELAPREDVASRIRAMPGPRGAANMFGDAASESAGATATGFDAAAPDSSGVAASRNDVAGARDQRFPSDREMVRNAGDRRPVRTAESRPAANPIVPLSPRRYKIEITVDEATHDKLRSLQDLLGRSETGRDPAAIIRRALEVLLDRTLTRKAGCSERPRSTTASALQGERQSRTAATPDSDASQSDRRTRTIPAAVRREVWQRDCGRCCYVDAVGRRCRETSNVEFHHKTPFAVGGLTMPENIELRCAAHNQYQADLDFGRSFMDGKRARNVINATFRAECCNAPTFMDRSHGRTGIGEAPRTAATEERA